MADAPDLGAAGQVLALSRHPLAEPFRKAAAAYAADGDLLAFEVALDRAFYRGWSEDAERLPAPDGFRRYVAAEIDATNLRTALKLRGADGDRALLRPRRGRPVGRRLRRHRPCAQRRAPADARGPARSARRRASLTEVEARLDAMLDTMARRLASDPLDVGLVTDYLRRKERETAQLRLLARGTYYGVPRAALAKELGDA
jgi:vacuolar-type H+-ATPase subunit C/Vma6